MSVQRSQRCHRYVGPFTERDIHKFVVDTILLQKNLLELDAPPTFK